MQTFMNSANPFAAPFGFTPNAGCFNGFGLNNCGLGGFPQSNIWNAPFNAPFFNNLQLNNVPFGGSNQFNGLNPWNLGFNGLNNTNGFGFQGLFNSMPGLSSFGAPFNSSSIFNGLQNAPFNSPITNTFGGFGLNNWFNGSQQPFFAPNFNSAWGSNWNTPFLGGFSNLFNSGLNTPFANTLGGFNTPFNSTITGGAPFGITSEFDLFNSPNFWGGSNLWNSITSPIGFQNFPYATGFNGLNSFSPISAIPFGGFPFNNIPFNSNNVPFNTAVPFGGFPQGNIPFANVPFNNVPFNTAVPFGGFPVTTPGITNPGVNKINTPGVTNNGEVQQQFPFAQGLFNQSPIANWISGAPLSTPYAMNGLYPNVLNGFLNNTIPFQGYNQLPMQGYNTLPYQGLPVQGLPIQGYNTLPYQGLPVQGLPIQGYNNIPMQGYTQLPIQNLPYQGLPVQGLYPNATMGGFPMNPGFIPTPIQNYKVEKDGSVTITTQAPTNVTGQQGFVPGQPVGAHREAA